MVITLVVMVMDTGTVLAGEEDNLGLDIHPESIIIGYPKINLRISMKKVISSLFRTILHAVKSRLIIPTLLPPLHLLLTELSHPDHQFPSPRYRSKDPLHLTLFLSFLGLLHMPLPILLPLPTCLDDPF